MPELPELEVVKDVLCRRVVGQSVADVQLAPKGAAIIVRDLTHDGFAATLKHKTIADTTRRGKFLVFALTPEPLFLIVNPKLTGRLQLTTPDGKRLPHTHVVFA
ncbi:MAG: formamidopyrimidine-DNA glycosylase, partial [Chloroflexi bacterium]|nr:formamidopyrimidine-DNA glycosylase [Chloroflexota bacterium]